ncbi:TRAP-type transport system small permease [Alcanivorax hongdengensis A-11-3]|uniref:TRAP transporter small permease protein n=1 Tax=Alcanivorax hongdengensis A-11-3 TaxID=1177179 RepID=L0WC73_9GAMM|nr:TRAP transporter small permease subunit [Alcanivorax hongdengensis]EKF74546.1 TRAP-type transport system small permease [Alcanivorax hongdengensis A-11-3]
MTEQLQRWQQRLTRFTCAIGRTSAWLALALVLVMVAVVMLRYAFGIGNIALQESLMYLHGSLFMLGIAYTLAEDEHVRVDVFYARFRPRTRAWVNLLGTLFLLLPVCGAIFGLSLHYVTSSWHTLEGSANGGLPFLYLLKSLLLVLPVLLLVQAIAELLRHGLAVAGHPLPAPQEHPGEGL